MQAGSPPAPKRNKARGSCVPSINWLCPPKLGPAYLEVPLQPLELLGHQLLPVVQVEIHLRGEDNEVSRAHIPAEKETRQAATKSRRTSGKKEPPPPKGGETSPWGSPGPGPPFRFASGAIRTRQGIRWSRGGDGLGTGRARTFSWRCSPGGFGPGMVSQPPYRVAACRTRNSKT